MATTNSPAARRHNIEIYQGEDFTLDLRIANPLGQLYDASGTYYEDDVVHKSDNTIWVALQSGFTGQAPAEGAYWTAAAATWDLTGMTFEGTIRTGVGESDFVALTVTATDEAGGRLEATLTAAVTAALTSKSYAYDIWYTDSAGAVRPLCYGTAAVIGAVTT